MDGPGGKQIVEVWLTVLASAAKQSKGRALPLDCFAALAMTRLGASAAARRSVAGGRG
jgi:hypothetical protein